MIRSPDEIKKGLECCASGKCGTECMHYEKDYPDCLVETVADALALIQQLEAVAKSVEQIRWERDIAIGQLKELGLSLGEKVDGKIPRWISVEERLPEVDKRYGEYEYSAELLVYDGLRVRAAYYCHTTTWWHDSRYEDDIIEVTHWMPLPEPPKEETT